MDESRHLFRCWMSSDDLKSDTVYRREHRRDITEQNADARYSSMVEFLYDHGKQKGDDE